MSLCLPFNLNVFQLSILTNGRLFSWEVNGKSVHFMEECTLLKRLNLGLPSYEVIPLLSIYVKGQYVKTHAGILHLLPLPRVAKTYLSICIHLFELSLLSTPQDVGT